VCGRRRPGRDGLPRSQGVAGSLRRRTGAAGPRAGPPSRRTVIGPGAGGPTWPGHLADAGFATGLPAASRVGGARRAGGWLRRPGRGGRVGCSAGTSV